MESDLLSTINMGPFSDGIKLTVPGLHHEKGFLAATIAKICRIKRSDLNRWFEGKLLKNTVFQ